MSGKLHCFVGSLVSLTGVWYIGLKKIVLDNMDISVVYSIQIYRTIIKNYELR